jgi:hypothetical protein
MHILCEAVHISVKYSSEDLINNSFFKNRYRLDVEILSSLTVKGRIDYNKGQLDKILFRISQTKCCR